MTKRQLKIIVLLFLILPICCICSAVGLIAFSFSPIARDLQRSSEITFFKEHKSEFEAARNAHWDNRCTENRSINGKLPTVEIGGDSFNIYTWCDSAVDALVFEGKEGFRRIDYIYRDPKATHSINEVDECSDRNGKLSADLTDGWYLCNGDWN